MISPPVQLAPDAMQHSVSPQKVHRPAGELQPSSMKPPSSTSRIPLSELTTLRPPSAEACLLPDGGRGSPVKGACTSSHPPPPIFSAKDIHQHISRPQKDQKKHVLITPKTSPAQPEMSPTSPTAFIDASSPELPVDNGLKPPYSYASLIGMAILRAQDRKLTLSAIYNWISGTFSYYSQSEAGWQNSIRHNLSLNKAFVKVERPKDEPGKGHYWTVAPGSENQFLRSRFPKKLAMGGKPATTTKKESKKRHVEFEDVPKMKRFMTSPAENPMEYNARNAPASPPLTDDKRKKTSLWDYEQSDYLSPLNNTLTEEDITLFEDFPTRSELYAKEFSYSANALDLVLSPPPSSSPMRSEKVGLFVPRTPAAPPKRTAMASPGTSLREHRQHMLQMLTSPDTEDLPGGENDIEDDLWLTNTPKPKEKSLSLLDSPWDEVAERFAFGSPEKRESRRRESRRSLICGLHAQELYETGFETSHMPGVNVLDIMKREVDKVKGSKGIRPSLMERSQSSLF